VFIAYYNNCPVETIINSNARSGSLKKQMAQYPSLLSIPVAQFLIIIAEFPFQETISDLLFLKLFLTLVM